jgi:cyclic-di-GMP-binding protein
MASDYSFDITCDFDHQEMANAVDQLKREIIGRYDFKGVLADVDYAEKDDVINIHTESEYKLTAILDILESKMVKRDLSLKILDKSTPEENASGSTIRKKIVLRSGLNAENAKKVTKMIRDSFPKAKPIIQGDEVRVISKSKDELQQIMSLFSDGDFELPLQFGNYR